MSASVLFVCLGNICRSPTAHAVFRSRADAARLDVAVDSAGTGGWHVGDPPDARAVAAAERRDYQMDDLRARQATVADFNTFSLILAMDRDNLSNLERMRPPSSSSRLSLFLDLAPDLGVREVPDPYYGGGDGFERVLDLIEAASDGLIAELVRSGS